jgi:hypothetical protein
VVIISVSYSHTPSMHIARSLSATQVGQTVCSAEMLPGSVELNAVEALRMISTAAIPRTSGFLVRIRTRPTERPPLVVKF